MEGVGNMDAGDLEGGVEGREEEGEGEEEGGEEDAAMTRVEESNQQVS